MQTQLGFLSRCLYHCSSYLHSNCDCDHRQERGVIPAEDACDSGGPKRGTPYVRQDGGHHKWPGPGGILWICLTLVRGVPEATGIRTAALAKKCKVNLEEANTDGELLPPQRCISKTQVCVYEDTNNNIVGAGSSGCDNLMASSFLQEHNHRRGWYHSH